MKNKGIIIVGSSNPNGNTKKIVDIINADFQFEVINLIEHDIGYFDYRFQNQKDDFVSISDKMIEAELIIFATPMYWYSMSATLKTYIDRLSDLLKIDKDKGRKLKGKSMMTICCGTEALDFDFFLPFRMTAQYLYMDYLGDVHTWLDDDKIPEIPLSDIEKFKGIINDF